VSIALGVRERLGLGVGAYIGGGQFVLALPASFQVSGQFVSAKLRTLLNADAMIAEDCEVRGDGNLLRQPVGSVHVEPIDAGVLTLVKAEISDLHGFPLPCDLRIASI